MATHGATCSLRAVTAGEAGGGLVAGAAGGPGLMGQAAGVPLADAWRSRWEGCEVRELCPS